MNDNNKQYEKRIKIIAAEHAEYTWQELNCFYRPFAYGMSLTCQEQKGENILLLLASFYMTHCDVSNSKRLYNRYHPFLMYMEHEVSGITGMYIDIYCYRRHGAMHRLICESIDRGNPVVVPVDLYELPYTRNYLRQHHRHYLLISGYDRLRKIYYIYDNMHISGGNTTAYSEFVMEFRVLENCADAFHKTYDIGISADSYVWQIRCECDGNDYNSAFSGYFRKAVSHVLERKEYYCVEREIARKEYGDNFLDMIEQINFRNVFYGETIRFLELNYSTDDTELNKIEKMCNGLKKKWNIIKYKLMRHEDRTEELIDDAVEMEKLYLRYILNLINDTHKTGESEIVNSKLQIYNPLKAEVNVLKNVYRIYIPETVVCDTWNDRDEAVQLLDVYKYKWNNKSLETEYSVKSGEYGPAFHVGIIAKGTKGEKILFGNSRNLHLVVFRPDRKQYVLYRQDYVFDESERLKVCIQEGVIMFNIFDDGWRKICETNVDFDIESIGVFVKTWEQCECDVEFRYIKSE